MSCNFGFPTGRWPRFGRASGRFFLHYLAGPVILVDNLLAAAGYE